MSKLKSRRLKIILVCLCLSLILILATTLIRNLTHRNDIKESVPIKETGKKVMICGTSTSKAIYADLDVLKQGGSAEKDK